MNPSPPLIGNQEELDTILVDACRVAMGLKPSITLSNDLDFDRLLEQSDAQSVTPYVFEYLDRAGVLAAADREIGETWQKAADLYASRFYWRKSQWPDVRALLASTGHPFIALKGAAFAFRGFSKPFRDMNDFDILVRKSDVLSVQARLERAGVFPMACSRFAWHSSLRRTILARGGALSIPSGRHHYEGNSLPIDLHWRLAYPVDGAELELVVDELWKEALPLGDGQWELPSTHQFLLVLAHAASSPTQKLSHWLDVIVLRQALGDGFDVQEFLLGTRLLSASPEARSHLWASFHHAWEALQSPAPARPRVMRRVVPGIYREMSFQERCQHHWASLSVLDAWERLLYLAGFCFPDRRYYRDWSTARACLRFYRDLFVLIFGLLREWE